MLREKLGVGEEGSNKRGREPSPTPPALHMNLAPASPTMSSAARPRPPPAAGSHLHIEERRAVPRPLLDQGHVLAHGLLLAHPLKLLPLVDDAGPSGGDLLLDPHVQHLLFLGLLPDDGARPEAPPQRPLQEAGPPLLQPLARGEAFGGLADAGPQPVQGVDLLEGREGGVQRVVPLQVLEPQGGEDLEVLLGGRVVAVDNGFVGLAGGGGRR